MRTVLPQSAYKPYYWDEAQCAALSLDIAKFPPFAAMGTRIGSFNGLPIIGGGPDFIMALVGTDTLEPGRVCDRAGSSEGINLCTKEPTANYANKTIPEGCALRILPHIIPGLWNAGFVIAKSGKLFEEKPGRATLAKMACRVKAGLAVLGIEGCTMTLSGGQAKSKVWNKMKARLTGCTLLVPEISDGELLGDAVLGALFLQGGSLEGGDLAVNSLRQTAARMARIAARYEPVV
jgi:xylulokinase